ncbi:MAG: endonuclease [Candidatus Pacebacteria bacterium]|nr:endonuclease [Candidatus Paceibacterota bacterium]
MKKRVLSLFFSFLIVLGSVGAFLFYQSHSETSPAPAQVSECPLLFVSWNIVDLGRSKSDDLIETIAEILQYADIVALQEVTAGKNFGAQAIKRLVQELLQKGSSWDYVVSDPTSGPGSERYAYLLRNGVTFSRDDAYLLKDLDQLIDREPYTLKVKLDQLPLVNLLTVHTVPTKKAPTTEVVALSEAEVVKTSERMIISGDFNLPGRVTDKIFEPLGYHGHVREKTSLKRSLDGQGGHRLHQYDNIYTKGVHVCESGVIDFVSSKFSPVTNESLKEARKISDHLPVYIRFR